MIEAKGDAEVRFVKRKRTSFHGVKILSMRIISLASGAREQLKTVRVWSMFRIPLYFGIFIPTFFCCEWVGVQGKCAF